jgi:predicted MPP superfamily phosphohydrolase
LIIFLTIFLSLYGGLNLYGFLKAKKALSLSFGASLPFLIFIIIMVFVPILVRLTEKQGFETIARLLAFIGYFWMGLLFFFVSTALLFDLYHLLVYLVGLVLQKNFTGIGLSPRISFFIPFFLCLAIAVYGYFEAIRIKTEHITLRTSKIPEEASGLRIVQISDVHLGLIVREERLRRILEQVKGSDPDILISTGDLVDSQMDNLAGLAAMFREIRPKYGKFAVTGNHEFYAGLELSLDFTKKAGFTILRGEGLTVSGQINIAGMDDPGDRRRKRSPGVSERAVLYGLPRNHFTILLKHRPLLNKETIGLFDLQLSGHTHKGQIFPWNLITRLSFPKDAGLFNLPDNAHLYVNRGSGTWGPPIRFLSPPEVTLIELVHEGK